MKEDFDIPDEYWYIDGPNIGEVVSEETKDLIVEKWREAFGLNDVRSDVIVEFQSLPGRQIIMPVKNINFIMFSTPEFRKYDRVFNKVREQEKGYDE